MYYICIYLRGRPPHWETTRSSGTLYWRERADDDAVPPWVEGDRDATRSRRTYCKNCYRHVHKNNNLRVPMRNVLELLRTRFHIDKCYAALYEELRGDLNWWPPLPHMSDSDLLEHFTTQWEKIDGGQASAREALEKHIDSNAFESKEALLRAVRTGVSAQSNTRKHATSTSAGTLDAQDSPELDRLYQELLEQTNVVESAASPIPKEFFTQTWDVRGPLTVGVHKILWQDAGAQIPLDQIMSQDARTAISVGRIYSHFRRTRKIRTERAGQTKQVPCYSHAAGNIQMKRKFPRQDAGMLGMVATSSAARVQYINLKKSEAAVVTECMEWLKRHNIWTRVYKTNLEALQNKLELLKDAFCDSEHLCNDAGETLDAVMGREDVGLIRAELSEYSGQYGNILTSLGHVGNSVTRWPNEETPNVVEAAKDAAAEIEKYITLSIEDVNLDAKVFVDKHPHGTGSFNSIPNCVSYTDYLGARIHELDSAFRTDRIWTFFQEDRKIKMQLAQQARFTRTEELGEGQPKNTEAASEARWKRRFGKRTRPSVATYGTAHSREYHLHKFGSRLQSTQVDSNKYYRKMKQDMLTVIRPENRGTPHGMLTFVGNDRSADVRAMLTPGLGPLAPVPQEFHIAHMLSSGFAEDAQIPVYDNPAIVTFSYMRSKKRFTDRVLRRGAFDSLGGVVKDYFAREEEQQRKCTHSHNPYMCERCSPSCTSMSRYCIRNQSNVLPSDIRNSEKDNMHKMLHMPYTQTELLRPYPLEHAPVNRMSGKTEKDVKGGGAKQMLSAMDDADTLVAYYFRRVQIQWTIHRCSSNYCKADGRCSCRFDFPFQEPCGEQQHNETRDRIDHIRRHIPDDQRVSAHNLETLVFTNSPCRNQVFDPIKGGRRAGAYCTKYTGKAEKLALLETVHAEDTEVVEYLKTRIIGANLTFYRHNGGKIVELNHDVDFFPSEFVGEGHVIRPLWHQKVRRAYPHALRFLTKQENISTGPSS